MSSSTQCLTQRKTHLTCQPDVTVTKKGVAKLLSNLQPHKATGPDDLPARLLKETAEEIAPAITRLYQASIDQAVIPNDWKEALVSKPTDSDML